MNSAGTNQPLDMYFVIIKVIELNWIVLLETTF